MFFKTLSILNILNQHTPTPDDNDIYTAGVVNSVQGSVSDEYSSEKAYAVGDYCIYNNTLYKCIQEKASGVIAVPPDASYWTNKNSDNSALTVGSEISSLNGNLTNIFVGKSLTSSDDLDDIITPGIYGWTPHVAGDTPDHVPVDGNGVMYVIASCVNPQHVNEELTYNQIVMVASRLFTRRKYNGTWINNGAWIEFSVIN